VSFNGTPSADPDGTIVAYSWDFGDGTTATGASPSHTYATAGSYTVKLTVTDNNGASDAVTQTLTVADQPPAVTAAPSSPLTPSPPFSPVTPHGSSPNGAACFNSRSACDRACAPVGVRTCPGR
jgi:PKD repeat protein